MGKEIEHKYLVGDDSYRGLSVRELEIRQGYLQREPSRTVRVRTCNRTGYLTVKGRNSGDTRLEFEYEIPYADAIELLSLCDGSPIEKIRYIVPFGGFTWEVDEYKGSRSGLVVAEIELPSSNTVYPLPPFVSANVTGDPRYYNSNL